MEEPSVDEVLDLARTMGVEVKTASTSTFKGGILGGRKVVLVPERSLEDEDLNVAILHELGHIKFGHSGYSDPKRFVLNELEANRWALTTKCGYPQEEWDWSLLPGIAEDLAEKFGLSLREAWITTKEVARGFGIGSNSIKKAEEELK